MLQDCMVNMTISRAAHFVKHPMLVWAVRAWVVLQVFQWLVPITPRAIITDTYTVETTKPQVCVHTRLIDEVYEWKIQRSLELVREMGATTIVEFFPWAYFEGQKGRYDWYRSDMILRHARSQGLRVIARMGFVPEWARASNQTFTTSNSLAPAAYADFARFVALFATRYADVVQDIIIWNEPNLALEWGYQAVSPEDYVQLLATVYPSVKAANPSVQLLAGALAPTLEPETSPHGMNDLIYLERMYAAGANAYFDGLAVHTYGFRQSAQEAPAPNTLNFRRVELLRDIMEAYGDAQTRVFITEFGWNDNARWVHGVRPAQRVQYTLDAFKWAESHQDWVDVACVWVFRTPAPTFGYPDNFTMATTQFQLKPIYYALQAYARNTTHTEDLWLPPPSASD